MGKMDSITSHITGGVNHIRPLAHKRRGPQRNHSCAICMVYGIKRCCLASTLSIGSVKLWKHMYHISYTLYLTQVIRKHIALHNGYDMLYFCRDEGNNT